MPERHLHVTEPAMNNLSYLKTNKIVQIGFKLVNKEYSFYFPIIGTSVSYLQVLSKLVL